MGLIAGIRNIFRRKKNLPRRLGRRDLSYLLLSLRSILAGSSSLPFSFPGISKVSRIARQKRGKVADRAEDQWWNNAHSRGMVELLTSLTIGDGLTIIPALADQVINEQLRSLWNRVSATGQLDAAPDQRRTIETLMADWHTEQAVDGECYVHRVYDDSPGRDVTLSLEVIDGHRVATPTAQATNPRVVDGIEYADDELTEIAAYWVRKGGRDNPLDVLADSSFARVPARDMVVFREYAPADVHRALSFLTTIMLSAEWDAMYMEDVQALADYMAKLMMWIKRPSGSAPIPNRPSMTDRTDTSYDSEGNSYTAGFAELLETGIQYGFDGEEPVVLNEYLPAPDLPGFRKAVKQMHSIATNIPQVFVDKDGKGVSYSGGVFAWQQLKPVIQARQRRFMAAFRTIWEWFIDSAVADGALELPGYSWSNRHSYTAFSFVGVGEQVINPMFRAKANAENLKLGLTSPTRIAAEEGRVWEDDFRQLCRDFAKAAEIAEAEGVPLEEVWNGFTDGGSGDGQSESDQDEADLLEVVGLPAKLNGHHKPGTAAERVSPFIEERYLR